MLPHKEDQSLISTPVSRVGSSARVNQLGTSSGSPSRPVTPNPYVTSSLNQARNLPVTPNNIRLRLKTPEELSQFEKLPVVQNLRQFEASFNKLSHAITSFTEEDLVAEVKHLIDIDEKIYHGLNLLETHHNLGLEILNLAKDNLDLDSQSKSILRELISCRAKLRNLPKLPASQETALKLNSVDVQTVLDYAMKLSKFSKTPATVLSQVIHPNNYIWPAEDALRRGMLATASIKPDELIRAEIGLSDPTVERVALPELSDLDVEMEDVDGPVAKREHTSPVGALPEANGLSLLHAKEPSSKPATATLDLDLFDPEDDEDDSD